MMVRAIDYADGDQRDYNRDYDPNSARFTAIFLFGHMPAAKSQVPRSCRVRAGFLAERERSSAGRLAEALPPKRPPFRDGS
jgi:hypothetical protein